jgi:hypothetical protein
MTRAIGQRSQGGSPAKRGGIGGTQRGRVWDGLDPWVPCGLEKARSPFDAMRGPAECLVEGDRPDQGSHPAAGRGNRHGQRADPGRDGAADPRAPWENRSPAGGTSFGGGGCAGCFRLRALATDLGQPANPIPRARDRATPFHAAKGGLHSGQQLAGALRWRLLLLFRSVL